MGKDANGRRDSDVESGIRGIGGIGRRKLIRRGMSRFRGYRRTRMDSVENAMKNVKDVRYARGKDDGREDRYSRGRGIRFRKG